MELRKVTAEDRMLKLINDFRKELDLIEQEVVANMPVITPTKPVTDWVSPITGKSRPIRKRKICYDD